MSNRTYLTRYRFSGLVLEAAPDAPMDIPLLGDDAAIEVLAATLLGDGVTVGVFLVGVV
jgi:hypothetical protein